MVVKFLTGVDSNADFVLYLTAVIKKQCVLVFNGQKVIINRVKNKIVVKNIYFDLRCCSEAHQSQLATACWT